MSLSLANGIDGLPIILLPLRRVVASRRNLFILWSVTSFVLWSYVSGRMAFTSIARTYANVNRDAPKSYWDYGTNNHMRSLFVLTSRFVTDYMGVSIDGVKMETDG